MLSPIRLARLAVTSVRLVRDHERLDLVFDMVDAISDEDMQDQMNASLSAHPRGAAAMQDRPVLGEIDLNVLAALPQGSLGRSFADFASAHGIEPKVLTDEAKNREQYASVHLYETHDLWHVATGSDTDILGELRLQAFYLAQHPWEKLAPLLLAIALLKTSLKPGEFAEPNPTWRAFEAMVDGWTLGRRAEPLFGVRWADRWEQPLSEFQAEFGLA